MFKKQKYSMVGFNESQRAAFDTLKDKGLITEKFSEFVKAAFHEKMRAIKGDE